MPQNAPSGVLNTAPDSNGLNVHPELMPESFFFLEKDKTYSQTAADKFGIVGTGANSTFRTTSRISYTGKVFTICQGQVFIQPMTGDATKVNVVLKPFSQPIKGLAIKYIVYRGLSKNDFFTNDGKVQQSGSNATDFVNHVREEFQNFYGSNGVNTTPPQFLAEFLGYPNASTPSDQQQNELDLVDDYFYKVSQATLQNTQITEPAKKAYEMPLIKSGIYLGNASGSFGIDIVLNEGDYSIENDPNPFQLNLKFVRAADHILNPADGNTDFKKKLIKETATGFIDIAAFYGLHTQGKGKVKVNTQTTPLTSKDEIYDLIRNFSTCNTTYLYIQSNRQRSYNFYGNYKASDTNVNNFKIGIDANNLQEGKFDDNWPVYEVNNVPSLVIQLTTDNHALAGMYVKQGILSQNTQHEDGYIRNENLLQQNGSNIDINFTKPIGFGFTKTQDNKPIASFIQLIYEGKQLPVEVSTPAANPNDPPVANQWYMKDIDDVFGLINAVPHVKPKTDYEQHYVTDQNLLLINFENKTGRQDIATVTTKRIEDLIMKNETEDLPRVTYETLLHNIRQNVGSFFQSSTAYVDNSNSGTLSFDKGRNNYYRPQSPYYLQTEVFTSTEGTTITGLSLNVQDGSLPSKKILGITKAENDVFTALIGTTLNNPKFFFKNELEDETSYYTSTENISYRRYSLAVLGEDQTGKLQLLEPATKILVSTVDNLVYASEEYAKWMPVVNTSFLDLYRNDLTS